MKNPQENPDPPPVFAKNPQEIKIAGFQKNSFIDYPGKIAAVVFTGGCNLRCYYCHNFGILKSDANVKNFDEILDELKEQVGDIDAVVISGGEPTLHPHLKEIIAKIRALGFLIKLDTNGSNPGLLRELVDGGSVDYVAIDVKCSFDNENIVKGIECLGGRILQSINFLKSQTKVDYMFRTTLAPALDIEDMKAIAKMITGAKTYQMQQFVPNENSEKSCFAGLKLFTPEQVAEFAEIFKPHVGEVLIRGF